MANKNEFIKLYCFGCGALLQNDNPDKPGFVPKQLEKDSKYMCQRCFRLQNYGITNEEITDFTNYDKIVTKAKKERSLIIYVVDLFAFECSIIHTLLDKLKDARVVVVASKRDVIPTSIKDEKLKEFIAHRFDELGIKPLDIMISSAKKNYNIEEIKDRCDKLRKGKNVYIFGASSVGKSSLVNAFLKIFTNKSNEVISTSPYPGTTLDVIKVPVEGNTYVYDTPGVLLPNSIYAHVDSKLVKYVMPRKEIKPRVYQLQSGQSLMIENIAKIDFEEGAKANISLYLSNDLNITRSKLENSNRAFANMIANKQFKHIDRKVKSIDDLSCHEFNLANDVCDVVITGLLWFKVKGQGQKISIYAPKGVEIAVRECKI